MPGDNRNMAAAKQVKNDEFYTRLEDVEAEMRHYAAHFKGGTGAVYPGHPDLGYYTSDGRAVVPYRRVLVRNRFPVP